MPVMTEQQWRMENAHKPAKKPTMSFKYPTLRQLRESYGNRAFDRNQKKRDAIKAKWQMGTPTTNKIAADMGIIKKAAFFDELQKLGGALASGLWLVKAVGKRLKTISGLGSDAAKTTAKKRTMTQLDNAARQGSNRIIKAEDALKNSRQSMGSIAKNSKRLEEAKELVNHSKKLKNALHHSYDPKNKKILQGAIDAAGA